MCTENICRSPLAEGLLRHHLASLGVGAFVQVSSAGTIASQPGARPDPRALKIASDAGIKLGRIRARRVTEKDIARADLIIPMDASHQADLLEKCPPEHSHRISLLLSHDPAQTIREVPDPYYGSYEGFVEVFQLIDRATRCLAGTIADWRVDG